MRTAIACLAAATLLAPKALAQDDPRPAAHARVNAILNSNLEGADTPYGYIPDLLSYYATGSGCDTQVIRTQRAVYRRNRRLNSQTVKQSIYWDDIREVGLATIPYRSVTHDAVILISKSGTELLYATPSSRVMHELRNAMLILKNACAPGARQPAPVPAPRPIPAAGWRWVDKAAKTCVSNAVSGLHIFSGERGQITYAATRIDGKSYFHLMLWAPSISAPPYRSVFSVHSPSGRARTATLSFDGRPSGLSLAVTDASEGGGMRLVYPPADIVDRFAGVAAMTLTLLAADGSEVTRFDFQVPQAQRVRGEVAAARWICDGAR